MFTIKKFKFIFTNITDKKSNISLIKLSIEIIAIIADFDSSNLYNLLLTSKHINNNLLKNITVINLNNYRIYNEHLKYIPKIESLCLPYNIFITDNGLKYISHIKILKLK